jgi:hypothetical protein
MVFTDYPVAVGTAVTDLEDEFSTAPSFLSR